MGQNVFFGKIILISTVKSVLLDLDSVFPFLYGYFSLHSGQFYAIDKDKDSAIFHVNLLYFLFCLCFFFFVKKWKLKKSLIFSVNENGGISDN